MRFEILSICNKVMPQSDAKMVIKANMLSSLKGEVTLILVALNIIIPTAIILKTIVNIFILIFKFLQM